MNTKQKLQIVFATNFMTYYKAHSSHVNITGRNFVSDHKLLGDIYEDLQDQIDTIGEILRTLKEKMPFSLYNVMNDSIVGEDINSDNLLLEVYNSLEALITENKELIDIATQEELHHIANYAQDRVLKLEKFCWMLRSVLEEDDDE